jgi:uncharacterized protein with HEPN domain
MKSSKVFDEDRLLHILDAILFIKEHTSKLNVDQFLRDEVLKRAIVREFEVIGEAANYISKDIKDKFALIEWAKIISLRNRLIHEYNDVNYRTVWEIISVEIDNLKINIENILDNIK